MISCAAREVRPHMKLYLLTPGGSDSDRMKIEELNDFPALRQLAHALWREGTARGAAVLVGAGFSRNATLAGGDTPKPPLWGTLSKLMAAELYDDPSAAPADPLRLAEEYRTNFLQAVLDQFVRTHIPDAAWQPGALHKKLLELPWSDVLTTNWDTLLERTRATRRWEPVRSTADLAHGRGRRIIKLHGTIGVTEHFIFAEEDYRTYPSRFAAFVNTARQIFIENELCLLGFSGDDPNFLQWSGWVRDHLSENARRIYLVGVLDLHPTRRKFLESRNIAPIDLGPLFPTGIYDDRSTQATELFLRYLADTKPKAAHEWRPSDRLTYPFAAKTQEEHDRELRDADYAASLLDKAAEIWRNERESYPGWLVCPHKVRSSLYYASDIARWRQPEALSRLEQNRRAAVLFEMVWRSNTAFQTVDERLQEHLIACANPAQPWGLEKQQQLEIILTLLRLARQQDDDEAFIRWSALLSAHTEPGSDLRAQVAYQRCLRARDRLDQRELSRELASVEGLDPAWKLRRAALHCELGQFAEASQLITNARDDLVDRRYRDEDALWVRSRLAWAEWMFGATSNEWRVPAPSPWAADFRESLCDPEDELERIANQAADSLRDRQEQNVEAIPQFEAGHYKDPSKTARIRDGVFATPLQTLAWLTETAGLPLRLNHFNMVGKGTNDVLELDYEPTFAWYIWLIRTRHSQIDRLFDRYLGRVAIAQLPEGVAVALAAKITTAIGFWRERIGILVTNPPERTEAVERLRPSIEALARLTARLESESARAAFDLAMDLARDPFQHHWLIEPISNLAKYSVQAIDPRARSALVLAALECPLSSEKGVGQTPWEWLNPADSILNGTLSRPEGDTRWLHRIVALIQQVAAGGTSRPEAVIRLAYLARAGVLTSEENESFATALWSIRDASTEALPANTRLLATAFVHTPAPVGIDREALVRAHLFDTNFAEVLATSTVVRSSETMDKLNRLAELSAAAGSGLVPTHEQAARLFTEIIRWAATTEKHRSERTSMFHFFERQHRERFQSFAGSALARLVVPALAQAERTEASANEIFAFITGPSTSTAIPALPYYAHLPTARSEITRRIRRAVASRHFEEVSAGGAAIEKWVLLSPPESQDALPEQVVEQLVSSIETRQSVGLHALIHCACMLVDLNRLRAHDIPRLEEALGDLMVETSYEDVEFDSKRATSISLIRVECVRLARALQKNGADGVNAKAWLNAANTDPLPEVRFALAQEP